MAFHGGWEVKDKKLPVKLIEFYDSAGCPPMNGKPLTEGARTLKICFESYASAQTNVDTIRIMDPRCTLEGHKIILSDTITPQHLSNYLLEQVMIDTACYAELQKEMKHYNPRFRSKDGFDGNAR